MIKQIDIKIFLEESENIPVVDVRTPAEYEHAHIPGAFNIPLFTNEERALVGTTYKKQGKEQAVELGLKLVGTKLYNFVRQAKKIAKNKQLLLHCWRGGMRSASMAWLFQTAGLQVKTLEGGYKAYRRNVKSFFAQKFNLIVLGGMTGSGKTEILEAMEKMGEQIINLEKVAHHKGSAFGALGQKKQTSTEQFENNLFDSYKYLDINKTVWIEDESQAIGHVRVPEELYVQIRNSPVIKLNIPKKERIKFLLHEYGKFEAEQLKASVLKIKKRLGGLKTKQALEAVKTGDLETVVDISLDYYDKAYNYGITKRESALVFEIELAEINANINSKKIIDFYKGLIINDLKNNFAESR
ncbi:MAG: tRNA 2-selenouridine(34) synthase MnmH [Bacteroidales bacterium]|nr:tRNA 2-selenouridine(34) synthase MnmH [Bacteroidales bacterium]